MNHTLLLIPLHSLHLSIRPALLKDEIRLLSPRPRHALAREERVHLFHGNTLGLRHEEEDEGHADDDRTGEEEERAVGDVVHHVGCRIHNDELGQPLGAGREDEAHGTNAHGEHFGTARGCVVSIGEYTQTEQNRTEQ